MILRAVEEQDLSAILRDFKSYTAKQIIKFLKEKKLRKVEKSGY